LDAKAGGAEDAEAALQLAEAELKNHRDAGWLLLRLVQVAGQAGVAPEKLQAVASGIPQVELRGRAQLAALRARLPRPQPVAPLPPGQGGPARGPRRWGTSRAPRPPPPGPPGPDTTPARAEAGPGWGRAGPTRLGRSARSAWRWCWRVASDWARLRSRGSADV